MEKTRVNVILILFIVLLAACSPSESAIQTAIAQTFVAQQEPTHPATTQKPTSSPTTTPTPEPEISCTDSDVENYIKDLELLLAEWNDTETRAGKTARIALSPVVGELQDLRRKVVNLPFLECGSGVNDLQIIAMNLTIKGYEAFMIEKDDGFVSNLLDVAEDAHGFAGSELEKFKDDPFGSYLNFNKKIDGIDEKEKVVQPLELNPEKWEEYSIPQSSFLITIPKTWKTELGNSINDLHRFEEIVRKIKIKCDFVKDPAGIVTDFGRFYELETFLKAKDYRQLEIHSSSVDYIGENKVFYIYYSRVYLTDYDEFWAVIKLPDNDLVECRAVLNKSKYKEEK